MEFMGWKRMKMEGKMNKETKITKHKIMEIMQDWRFMLGILTGYLISIILFIVFSIKGK